MIKTIIIDDPPLCSLEFLMERKIKNLNVVLAVSHGILSTYQYDCKIATKSDIQYFCKSEYTVRVVNHSFDHNNFHRLKLSEQISDLKRNAKLLNRFYKDYFHDKDVFIVPRGKISIPDLLILNFIGYKVYGTRNYKKPLSIFYRSRSALYEQSSLKDHESTIVTYTHDIRKNPSEFGVTPEKFMQWVTN